MKQDYTEAEAAAFLNVTRTRMGWYRGHKRIQFHRLDISQRIIYKLEDLKTLHKEITKNKKKYAKQHRNHGAKA